VWVIADVYEDEIPLVRVGSPVSIEIASVPGGPIEGRVAWIAPTLSDATRTARVRIEVRNEAGAIRPGAYAVARIESDLGEQLVVDVDAVLDTGTRRIAFVETEEGDLRPAPGRARRARRGPGGRPVRARGGREGRRPRGVPGGLGEPAEGRAALIPVIARIIDFSARNRFLVLVFAAVAVAAGVWSLERVRLDAIPDLSDTQVIVYSRWDRSPDVVEDQVTYPIVSALLGAPRVKAIRGFSDFGYSFVYVVFQDGTDIQWARGRTLEYLSKILASLPEGVRTELGRTRRASGGCTSTRSSTAAGRTTRRSCGASRTGACARGFRASPASRRSRPSAASRCSTRCSSTR
jgi:hypothetical protein